MTVLLLRNTKKFLIYYPCKVGDVKACRAQVKKTPDKRRKAAYKCCFYDELVKEEGGGGGGGDDLGALGFATGVKWNVEKARCGGKVKLTADSDLPDGTEVTIKYATEDLKCDEATVQVKGGKIEHEWTVKGVGFAMNDEKQVLHEVKVTASLESGDRKAAPDKALTVLTLVESKPLEFDKNYTWGIYSVHAKFTQNVQGRNQKVLVKKKVLKTWGATYVNLKDAGFKDAIPGIPWAGHRWARSKSGHMVPDEYWDGKMWNAIPDGVLDDPQNFGTLPIVRTGDVYSHPGDKSFVWPDTMKDLCRATISAATRPTRYRKASTWT